MPVYVHPVLGCHTGLEETGTRLAVYGQHQLLQREVECTLAITAAAELLCTLTV